FVVGCAVFCKGAIEAHRAYADGARVRIQWTRRGLLLADDVYWPDVRHDFSAFWVESRNHRSNSVLASGGDGHRQRCNTDSNCKRPPHAPPPVAGPKARTERIGVWGAGRGSRIMKGASYDWTNI